MDNERYTYSNNQYPNDYGKQSSGSGYYYSRPDYTTSAEEGNGYRSVESNRVDRSYIPNEPVKKPKKKSGAGSVFKKLLLGAAVGAFFGISAGVAFYFVNLATGASDSIRQDKAIVEEAQQESAREEAAPVEKVEVSESGIERIMPLPLLPPHQRLKRLIIQIILKMFKAFLFLRNVFAIKLLTRLMKKQLQFF